MARFYADEEFPLPVVQELRRLGHDVVTVQEAGHAGRSDADVLAVANSLNRAVLTRNRRHFIRLHASSQPHAGIVVCTDDNDFTGQAQRIHVAITPLPTLADQLVRITRPHRP